MTRLLVIGGVGFISSNFIRHILLGTLPLKLMMT